MGEQEKLLAANKDAGLKFAETELQKLIQEYGQYPICKYVFDVFGRALTRGQYSFGVFKFQWLSNEVRHVISTQRHLAWTVFAHQLDSAITEKKLDVASCQANQFDAAEPLREA